MYKNFIKVLMVMVLVSLLFSFGCKNTVYDIGGEWDFEIVMDDGTAFVDTYRFSGSLESGDVYYNGQVLGSYTVYDRSVNFTVSYYDEDDDYTVETFSGYFDDKYSMSGNYTLYIEGYGTYAGSWTAR